MICFKSKYIHTIEQKLQQGLKKISKWAESVNGFRFSKTKTKCPFLPQKKVNNDPVLKLDNSETPVVDEYKFLGMIIDKKLSFIPHLKYLKTRCNKTLQLLCVVTLKEWVRG